MAKYPYGISGSNPGKPRKLMPDWALRSIFGGGLPGEPYTSPQMAEFTYDEYRNPWATPLWQEGAFTNISKPSRNAGLFSFPSGVKSVDIPRGRIPSGPLPGEKFTDLTPQQAAVSNEIISRGYDPQHIYDIYTATTKVDAAGEPVLPLERVHSQKQQDSAGRIINESIASAKETRPELFTEPAARGEAIPPIGKQPAKKPRPAPALTSPTVSPSKLTPAKPWGEILYEKAESPLMYTGKGRDGGVYNLLPSEFLSDLTQNQKDAYLGEFLPGPSFVPLEGQTAPDFDALAEARASSSNEILPQPRFSNLRPLGPGDSGVYGPSGIEVPLVTYGKAVDRPGGHRDTFDFSVSPPQEVSGEQAAAVPIDPADLVGGSFFSGPNQTGGPAIPGSGFRYSHPVHKGAAQMPFSELGALNREGADWQKKVGPAMTVLGGSQIPGASLLGLFAAGLNKLGAYDRFNPATDSNLFADPETGRATWGTTDPGGSGSQRGTLNLYNMLQDYGGSYPTRQVQTPSRIGPTGEPIKQYANARDLAYIMGRGDRPPPGLYTQQTPVGYQDFGEGHNVTNQEALNTYNLTGAGAILNEAAEILGPDAGYNETSALAESMAEDLQGQVDYGDWGSWY